MYDLQPQKKERGENNIKDNFGAGTTEQCYMSYILLSKLFDIFEICGFSFLQRILIYTFWMDQEQYGVRA